MQDHTIRELIFTDQPCPILEDKHVIYRKNSRGCEIDIKFKKIDDAEYFLRNFNYTELTILAGDEDIKISDPKIIFEDGIKLMEEEKYWLAHEYFEKLWKMYEHPFNTFFHSVVLYCVSMVHHQMKRDSTKERIYNNAKEEIMPFLGGIIYGIPFSYPLESTLINHIKKYGEKIFSDGPQLQR